MLFHVDWLVSNKFYLFVAPTTIESEDIANGNRIRVDNGDLIGL